MITKIILVLLVACCFAFDPYKVLQIDKSASKQIIKKAFRKLQLQYHPDKGGSPEKLAQVDKAFRLLDDDVARMYYDRERRILSPEEADKIRKQLEISDERRPPLKLPLKLTLEQAFNGVKHVVLIKRQTRCEACGATGAKGGIMGMQKCTECNGEGQVSGHVMIAPGFVMQSQKKCTKCSGKGFKILSPCSVCQGKRITIDSHEITVNVEPGTEDGHQITVSEAGDAGPDYASRDLVFLVSVENENKVFKRNGKDLHIKVFLTLDEALKGFERTIKHMDGSEIKLKRTKVTQPDFVEKIADLGMKSLNPEENAGFLYVKYKVILPE